MKCYKVLEIWNIRSIYRVGSLKSTARELANYNLDTLGVQVR
jgi:hypothetical protein